GRGRTPEQPPGGRGGGAHGVRVGRRDREVLPAAAAGVPPARGRPRPPVPAGRLTGPRTRRGPLATGARGGTPVHQPGPTTPWCRGRYYPVWTGGRTWGTPPGVTPPL